MLTRNEETKNGWKSSVCLGLITNKVFVMAIIFAVVVSSLHSQMIVTAVFSYSNVGSLLDLENTNATSKNPIRIMNNSRGDNLVSQSKEPLLQYPIETGLNGGVKLVHDKAWFDEKAQAGCCPYAITLYQHRYKDVNYRCCTDRLGEIEPWRPIGGPDWGEMSSSLGNSSIFIQGDSLAEQHFLALLCYAWASEEANVTSLINTKQLDNSYLKEGTTWEARIEPVGITVTFCRWNRPTIIPRHDYSTVNHLIVGGWHHGGTETIQLTKFLNQLQILSSSSASILVVEALPAHFPETGCYRGLYKKEAVSGKSWGNSTSNHSNLLCDVYSTCFAPPELNKHIEHFIRDRKEVKILQVAHLYQFRGDAHVGFIPQGTPNPGRDCLHWCLAPGVLDTLAMETLYSLR